jgi:hypothetical protein
MKRISKLVLLFSLASPTSVCQKWRPWWVLPWKKLEIVADENMKNIVIQKKKYRENL